MSCGEIFLTVIDKFAVHFVREKIEPVFSDYIRKHPHLTMAVESARRIVRIADQNGLRPVGYEFLEMFHFREGEVIFYVRLQCTHLHSRHIGESKVVRIGRLRRDQLVSRVHACQERKQNRLGCSGRDCDVIRRIVHAVPGIIFRYFLPQRQKSL